MSVHTSVRYFRRYWLETHFEPRVRGNSYPLFVGGCPLMPGTVANEREVAITRENLCVPHTISTYTIRLCCARHEFRGPP